MGLHRFTDDSQRRIETLQTAYRKPRRAGDKLNEHSLLLLRVVGEDRKEELNGLRVSRVAVIQSTRIHQVLHRPALTSTFSTTQHLLHLIRIEE